INSFIESNQAELNRMVNNELTFKDLKSLPSLYLNILKTTLLLIPIETSDKNHKKLIMLIVESFAKKIFSDDRDEKIDFVDKRDFFEKLSYLVLCSNKDEIKTYLKPFLENFNGSESMADLLNAFVSAEDS